MKKSAEFEQLVARIVAELEPSATVTWDDHILGELSGIKRQIDVSIRRQDPEFLGIIDAKDYARPATVERIDALTGVMRDVEANYGALVCSGGFAKSIHNYARSCGISLFNAHDAQSANWCLELQIPLFWVELTPFVRVGGAVDLQAGDSIVSDDSRFGLQVTTDGGKSKVAPISTFERLWNEGLISPSPGAVHRIGSTDPVEAFVEDESGESCLRPVTDYQIEYVVSPTVWLGKFQPDECRGLVDYLDDQAFFASHLPGEAVPVERDDRWELVKDPDKLAVKARGTVVVCTNPVALSDGRMEQLEMRFLGPPEDANGS